jgi:hypothetical protein
MATCSPLTSMITSAACTLIYKSIAYSPFAGKTPDGFVHTSEGENVLTISDESVEVGNGR